MKVHGEYPKSINQDRNVRTERQDVTSKRSPDARAKNAAQSESSATMPKFLENSKKILTETPEVDTKRIREMRDRIAKGEYNIKPDQIADKILRLSAIENEPLKTD